jgi:hypothetical protein
VDINQVYRAPSIPKLSKSNISSPVLRGAVATAVAKPKLTTSKFSFLKPKISAESLKTEAPTEGINETLAETNQILVEIQKQLSLDFAMRIAEEKDTLKKVKDAESKRKFSLKEKSVESVKKIGGVVGGVLNKVTAPVKRIFDKIKEFFGLILTGIIINKAFSWLQDEGNRKNLDKIFNFIGTYWKEIAGVLIGIKVAATIASIAGTLGIAFSILTNPLFLKAAALVGAAALFMYGQKKIAALQEKAREKEIEGIEKRTGKPVSAEKKKVLEERDLQLRTNFGGSSAGAGIYFSSFLRGMGKNKGGTIDVEPKNSVRGYKNGGTFWDRMSGTVRGAGSMMVDSVKALLAPGEEIIRATSAMLFRPLLKDINDNAGRLWVEFSDAVKKLVEVSALQTSVSNNFTEVIEDFDERIKRGITDKRTGGGFSRPRQASVNPTQKIENNIIMSAPSGPGGMKFLPMMLPKQSSKPPQIPQMKTNTTEVSAVPPINVSNYWMDVTPELYGIQLYA